MNAEGYRDLERATDDGQRWDIAVQWADCTPAELREARLLYGTFGLESGLAYLDRVKARKGKKDAQVP